MFGQTRPVDYLWPLILSENVGFRKFLDSEQSTLLAGKEESWNFRRYSSSPRPLPTPRRAKSAESAEMARNRRNCQNDKFSVSLSEGFKQPASKKQLKLAWIIVLREKPGRNYFVQYWLLEESKWPDFWVLKRMSENHCVEVFKAHTISIDGYFPSPLILTMTMNSEE